MIQVENLIKTYKSGLISKDKIIAVNDISFSIDDGETLGLTGASGCGKSTIARIMLRLIQPDSGKIILNGQDITVVKGKELRKLRTSIQIMFQNPESSLNPRMRIYDCITELMRIHGIVRAKSNQEKNKVMELIGLVGLQPEHLKRYPGELSGGQIQRAVLARVMSVEPRLLVADEPTSMLDVSVQAQILSLLKEMQRKYNFACLFISHDLDVLKIMCDKTAVMYKGSIVEKGLTENVLNQPTHPYSAELIRGFDLNNSILNKGSEEVAS